jgi:hypothetical protein
MASPDRAYQQGRLQARHGARLTESQWRHFAGTQLLGGYLQSMRRTALEPWVRRLSEGATHHAIELALRVRWRGYVAELAGWQTDGWADAVAWVDRLTDLPVALELCRAGQLGPWAEDDPVYGDWVRHESGYQEPMARDLGPDILAACAEGRDPLPAWQAAWRAHWPAMEDRVRRGLEVLISVADEHRVAMASATEPVAGGALASAVEKELNRLFRAYARTPVALFAHLGMVTLDMERLRAALVQRALYPAERAA